MAASHSASEYLRNHDIIVGFFTLSVSPFWVVVGCVSSLKFFFNWATEWAALYECARINDHLCENDYECVYQSQSVCWSVLLRKKN